MTGIEHRSLYVGNSDIRRSVAPNGRSITDVSLLLVVTGDIGGALAAL